MLFTNGFVAKANQIFGFIQCKVVFDMIFSRISEELLQVRITQFCHLFNDTYRSFFYNFCMYRWMNCFDNTCKNFNSAVELTSDFNSLR